MHVQINVFAESEVLVRVQRAKLQSTAASVCHCVDITSFEANIRS